MSRSSRRWGLVVKAAEHPVWREKNRGVNAKLGIGLALVAVAFGLLVAGPAPARESSRQDPGRHERRHRHERKELDNARSGSRHTPELDPGAATSAAVLLIGGTLVLCGRRQIEPQD